VKIELLRCGVRATIVLLNNNGGGIFRRLPVAGFEPPFTSLFLTPHHLDFEPAARMYGAAFTRVESRADFHAAFHAAVGASTPHILEVKTDSALHERVRRQISTQVAGKLT